MMMYTMVPSDPPPLNYDDSLLMNTRRLGNLLLPVQKVMPITHAQRDDCIGTSSDPMITIMPPPPDEEGDSYVRRFLVTHVS